MSQILFFTPDSATIIPCEYQQINLIRKKKKIIDFHIQVNCSYNDYKILENNHLFNLFSEFKSPLFKDDFKPESSMALKLRLDKKLLPHILKNNQKEEEISQYLITTSQQAQAQIKDLNSILIVNNWYCLEVKQVLEEKTIGYQTLWNEMEPQKSNSKRTKSKKGNSIGTNFWTDDRISPEWEETSEKIGDFFDDLIDTLDKSITETKKENKTVSDIVKEFLREDNWNYLQLNDDITLQLTCQGNNGQITCYARIYDEQKQFIFYSLYPEIIPAEKRNAIAQLITRINYGMIIGNLEMDFKDGELRYKTSIDVEGDRISTALVKRVIYANIFTMDQYLPTITAILNEECNIEEAIAKVEN